MPNPPESPTVATSLPHRSGYVAIVGRPNVGKSTLLNHIIGQKVAIVTPKPQTTRGRILGIHSMPQAQIVFVDTPGLHAARTLLNRRIVQAAQTAIEEADIVMWLVDAGAGITAADRAIGIDLMRKPSRLCIVLNKIDRVAKPALLPLLEVLGEIAPGCDIVPVSATTGENVAELLEVLVRRLPEGPPFYGPDEFTDQTERTLAQEVVREQVLLQTQQEVPYSVAVTIDTFEERGRLVVIKATLHVERDSQKRILIGAQASRIKEIGRAARLELEKILDRKVYLELFVRVQAEWTSNPARLRDFGL